MPLNSAVNRTCTKSCTGQLPQTLGVDMNLADISPYGWYVASYLLRFVEVDETGVDDPEKRFSTWENTIIIKADSLSEAYDKAVQIAMRETESYKGGEPPGVDVQWVFEGITDLLPIYENLADGAEIMWASHGPRKLKNIRRCTRTKDDFIGRK